MKIDWESYFNKPNKYGVVPFKWENEDEKHNQFSKVICLCPVCNEKFIPCNIGTVIREDNHQTRMCTLCSRISSAQKRSVDWIKYLNYPNKYGVIPLRFVSVDEKINAFSPVVCSCPECNKEFVCSEIKRIIYEDKKQTQSCCECSLIRVAKKSGDTKLKNNEIENGTIVNYLMALYPGEPSVGKNGYRTSTTVCKCLLCGRIKTIPNHRLRGELADKSCGCLKSELEMLTQIELNKYNIETSKEYKFPNLKSSNGGLLRFDFAIHNNGKLECLIECQGKQHYYTDDDEFGYQQRNETDALKKEYCREHNILLYEIRFDEDVETRVKEILTELNL